VLLDRLGFKNTGKKSLNFYKLASLIVPTISLAA